MRFSGIALAALFVSLCAPIFGAETDAPKVVAAKPSKGSGGKSGVLTNQSIDVKGKAREYRLVAPENLSAEKAVPLLFAFHGFGDSMDMMPMYSRLDTLAEKQGCIVVYPNAIDKHWALMPAKAQGDFDFFDALYKELSAKYNVDLNRVYVTGMSNGAYFTNLLASVRSEQIAAIAPHSGGLGFVGLGGKKLAVAHKYPVMVIHGDKDEIVKVDEGRKQRDLYKEWGHEIEYVEVKGLKHAWGTLTNINAQMWEFFEKHPLK